MEHLFVGDEFDFVDFFYEVEDVHGAYVVLAQLGYLAGDVDVVDLCSQAGTQRELGP